MKVENLELEYRKILKKIFERLSIKKLVGKIKTKKRKAENIVV